MNKRQVEIEYTIEIDGQVVTVKTKHDADIIAKKLTMLQEDVDYYYELYNTR